MRTFPSVWLLLALGLPVSGCELVDQRTVARWFGGHPAAPGQAELDAARLPPLPLVTVRFDQPGMDYTPVLTSAAEDAMQRKPGVVFDVVTPVPTALPREQQDEFVRRGADDARAVAATLATAGVPPDQLRLGLRGDPGTPVRQVLVYVR